MSEQTNTTTATAPEIGHYAQESKEGRLPVIEIFGPTIQGEGAMCGVKTMFIRFGGCDYRCARCDSMHAVDPRAVKANSRWLTPEEIVTELQEKAGESNTGWVTISGGNPAIWDMQELVNLLRHQEIDNPKKLPWNIAVETQGTVWRDWLSEVQHLTICPKGPGMGERFNPAAFKGFLSNVMNSYNRMMGLLAASIKCVIFDQRDFEFAHELDKLLDGINEEHVQAIWWPRQHRFMSLGNSYQPVLGDDLKLHDPPILESADQRLRLLRDYKVLLEDYLADGRLSHWKFLPQLHVLIWGNESEK